MGVLSGNPKNEPMHYGEVFGVWAYLSNAQCMMSGIHTAINHIGDDDLMELLKDLRQELKEEIKECEELLQNNGIMQPPCAMEKPKAKWQDIPIGARFSDQEVATGLAKDIAAGLVACSQLIGLAIREDIALQFAKYHASIVQLGLRTLRIHKDKGWLVPPPLQVKAPEPVHA